MAQCPTDTFETEEFHQQNCPIYVPMTILDPYMYFVGFPSLNEVTTELPVHAVPLGGSSIDVAIQLALTKLKRTLVTSVRQDDLLKSCNKLRGNNVTQSTLANMSSKLIVAALVYATACSALGVRMKTNDVCTVCDITPPTARKAVALSEQILC